MSTIKVDNIEDKSGSGLKVQGTESIGTDTNVYVAGTKGAKFTGARGVTMFAGDLVTSGAMFVGLKDSTPVNASEISCYITGTSATMQPGVALASQGVTNIGGDLVVSGAIRGGMMNAGGGPEVDYDLIMYGDTAMQHARSHWFVSQNFAILEAPASDMTFFVSGSRNSKGTGDPMAAGTAVFGGDVVISGSLYANQQQVYSFGALVDTTSVEYIDFYNSQGASITFSQENHQMTAPASGQIKLVTLQQSQASVGTTNVKLITNTPPALASGGTPQTLIAQAAPAENALNFAVPSEVAGAIAAGDSWAIQIDNDTDAPEKVNITLIIEWDLRERMDQ